MSTGLAVQCVLLEGLEHGQEAVGDFGGCFELDPAGAQPGFVSAQFVLRGGG